MAIGFDRFMTAAGLERVLDWEPGRVDPVSWLVIQEFANDVSPETIAKNLRIELSELREMAEAVTQETGGYESTAWKNAVLVVKATMTMNHQMIATGWDGIEALAIQRLGRFMQENGASMTVKDALEIAQVANKANRRHLGEGGRGGVSLSVKQGGAGNPSDLDLELKSGNLGSIRMSLSHRVQAQLANPRIIDVEGHRVDREMLSLDETRKLVDEKLDS